MKPVTGASYVLAELKFGTLNVATPNIYWSAGRIDNGLVRIVETTMSPAQFYGESTGGLHVHVDRLAIWVATRPHADGRVMRAHEMI